MHERYRVAYDVGVAKDLRKLDKQVRKRVLRRVDKLAKEPRPHGVVKLTNEYGLYRIRVGDYRVIYRISDEGRLVYVVRVESRDSVYKDL